MLRSTSAVNKSTSTVAQSLVKLANIEIRGKLPKQHSRSSQYRSLDLNQAFRGLCVLSTRVGGTPDQIMLIDSHAHLDLYDEAERDAILRRAHAAGVDTILAIGIGSGPNTMHRALELAGARNLSTDPGLPRIFATAGIHPDEAANATPSALEKLSRLLADPLTLAVGEIGLDYYHVENPEPEIQKTAFIAQMKLAAAAGKPIVLHCRTSELATPAAKARFGEADAFEDLLALLTEHWQPTGLPGIMHCFSGTPDQAARSVALGFYLSFAGNLTYSAATQIREAAEAVPLDRILVETDAPFLAPIPHRGERNEPALVTHTAAALAALRRISSEELAAITSANFRTLFPTTRS